MCINEFTGETRERTDRGSVLAPSRSSGSRTRSSRSYSASKISGLSSPESSAGTLPNLCTPCHCVYTTCRKSVFQSIACSWQIFKLWGLDLVAYVILSTHTTLYSKPTVEHCFFLVVLNLRESSKSPPNVIVSDDENDDDNNFVLENHPTMPGWFKGMEALICE